YDDLIKLNSVKVVNLSKDDFKQGVSSFVRIIQIIKILKEVYIKKLKSDIIYFTISESFAGNLKDIFVYIICFKSLHKTIIHLHGGAGMKNILSNEKSLIYKINAFFVKRLGGVIILGESQFSLYSNIISNEKLFI